MANLYYYISLIFIVLSAYTESWIFVLGFIFSTISVFVDKYLIINKAVEKRIEDLENKVGKYLLETGLNDLRKRR